MFESKAECIGVCMQNSQYTYPLYPSFGGNRVDEPTPPMRRVIVEQLARYYPDVSAVQVKAQRIDAQGRVIYDIDIRG